MLSYALLPLIGFVIGLVFVSLGGGGGSLYVGVLTAFLGVPPAIAATTSLATGLLTTSIGSYSHWRSGNVNVRIGGIMLAFGAVAAIIGSLISTLLVDEVYTKITGIILLGMVVQMIYSYWRRRTRGPRPALAAPTRADIIKAACFGVFGGLLSGVAGLSGGAPIVAGLLLLGCSSLETVGTSVFVLAGMAAVSLVMHLGVGSVDWMLVALMGSGTALGGYLSPRLLARVSKEKLEAILQPSMIVLCAIMGTMLLLR